MERKAREIASNTFSDGTMRTMLYERIVEAFGVGSRTVVDLKWAVFDFAGRLVKDAPSEGAARKLAEMLNSEPPEPSCRPYEARVVSA